MVDSDEPMLEDHKTHQNGEAKAVDTPLRYSLDGVEDGDETYHGRRQESTKFDHKDMKRMGKTQELRRIFRPLSTLSFTVILQGTWEVLLVASYQGLVDGGLAGLFWSYIWTYCGMMLVVLSLAEMASMAPTSGGQYHWVSEFAPPKYQKYLSYITGWMSTLSWQAGTASGPFLVGTLIQTMVTVSFPGYAATNWQGTLMVIAVTVVVFVLNVWGARAMPAIQNLSLAVHVFGFLAVLIVLWVLAPRNTAEVVFTQFTNSGGWNSMGLSLMVGQISAIYACICSDAAAHISEEIKDASMTVPRAMLNSYLLNGGLGLVMLITYLFAMTDLAAALELDYPHIWVFSQAVGPAGVNGLTAIIMLLVFVGTVGFNLSTSRQTWSFARDRGLPLSTWLAKVDPKLQVPVNAVAFTCLFTVVLSLINIGSDVAFNAIISLNTVSLMLSYTISIGCVLFRRIFHPELLPPARWSLGRFGVPVNAAAWVYSAFAFFWCFWPNTTPVDKETFNWASVMFVAIWIISTVYYLVWGRKTFTGPVVLTEGWSHRHNQ